MLLPFGALPLFAVNSSLTITFDFLLLMQATRDVFLPIFEKNTEQVYSLNGQSVNPDVKAEVV
eukprot:Awhi_evm1s15050